MKVINEEEVQKRMLRRGIGEMSSLKRKVCEESLDRKDKYPVEGG